MKIYHWRKNYIDEQQTDEFILRLKIAVKTKETDWLDSTEPAVIPISIFSNFHREIVGESKMRAFISSIKDHFQGRILLLFSDAAHMHTMGLISGGVGQTLKKCNQEILYLKKHFMSLFQEFQQEVWSQFICTDSLYKHCYAQVQNIYRRDMYFKELIFRDVIRTYTRERSLEYFDVLDYINSAIQDLFEQAVCLLILARRGYKFQFYPGKQYFSIDYLNQLLKLNMTFVDVFVAVEKKTKKRA